MATKKELELLIKYGSDNKRAIEDLEAIRKEIKELEAQGKTSDDNILFSKKVVEYQLSEWIDKRKQKEAAASNLNQQNIRKEAAEAVKTKRELLKNLESISSSGTGMAGMFGVTGRYISGLTSSLKALMKVPGPLKVAILGLGSALIAAKIGMTFYSIGKSVADLTLKLTGFDNTLSVSGFFNKLKSIADMSRVMYSQSEQVGLTIKSMTLYAKAVERSGFETDTFSKRVSYMQKIVEGASKGINSNAKSVLNSLNLEISSLKAMSPDKMFYTIGTAIGSIEDETKRARAAMTLFERAGSSMIPLFRNMDQRLKESKQVLGEMPEILEQNKQLFLDISNNIRDLDIKGKQFFSGFLSGIGLEFNDVLKKVLYIDLTKSGMRVGSDFAIAFREAARGNLGGMITDFTTEFIRKFSKFFDYFATGLTAVLKDIKWDEIIAESFKALFKGGFTLLYNSPMFGNIDDPTMTRLSNKIDAKKYINNNPDFLDLNRQIKEINDYLGPFYAIPSHQKEHDKLQELKKQRNELFKELEAEFLNNQKYLETQKKTNFEQFLDTLPKIDGSFGYNKDEFDNNGLNRAIDNTEEKLINLKKEYESLEKSILDYRSEINIISGKIELDNDTKRIETYKKLVDIKDIYIDQIQKLQLLSESDPDNEEQNKNKIYEIQRNITEINSDINKLNIESRDRERGFKERLESIDNSIIESQARVDAKKQKSYDEEVADINNLMELQKKRLALITEESKMTEIVANQEKLNNLIKQGNAELKKSENQLELIKIKYQNINYENQIKAIEAQINDSDSKLERISSSFKNELSLWDTAGIYRATQAEYKTQIRLLDEQKEILKEKASLIDDITAKEMIQNEIRELETRGEKIKIKAEIELNTESFKDSVQKSLYEMVKGMGTIQQNFGNIFKNMGNSLSSAMSDAMYDIVAGAKTGEEAFIAMANALGQAMLRNITDTIANWIVSKATMLAMEVAFQAGLLAINGTTQQAMVAQNAAAAAETAVAWKPAAILSSIASLGIAVGVGIAALLAITAMIGGFASGGRVSGSKQIAWLNEEGSEYVVSAKSPIENEKYLDFANAGGLIEDLFSKDRASFRSSGVSDTKTSSGRSNVVVPDINVYYDYSRNIKRRATERSDSKRMRQLMRG